jgi:hypothetical protein
VHSTVDYTLLTVAMSSVAFDLYLHVRPQVLARSQVRRLRFSQPSQDSLHCWQAPCKIRQVWCCAKWQQEAEACVWIKLQRLQHG